MLSDNNRLLYVLTARRELNWQAFKKVYSALDLDLGDADAGIAYRRRQAVRTLDALAHCDADASNPASRIYSAPPALVRLPGAGLPQAVLCGARTPSTWNRVQAAAAQCGKRVSVAVEVLGPEGSHIPDRLIVRADEEHQLTAVASALSIHYAVTPPAGAMLHLSASLDAYVSRLRWEEGPEPNWRRSEFDVATVLFRQPHLTDSQIAVRLCEYVNPITGTPTHLLWRGSSYAKVDAIWARYEVLRERNVPGLYYDWRRQTLACPAGAPLPRMLSRALTLCTGYAPTTLRGVHLRSRYSSPPERLTVYYGVPPAFAKTAAEKLGQRLASSPMLLDQEQE